MKPQRNHNNIIHIKKGNPLKRLYFLPLMALLAACSPAPEAKNEVAPSAKHYTVAITAIVEHPALDSVRHGIIDQLADDGFREGENLTINFQSAQGNMGTAGQIARQFVSENPDVIVPIATPSAQSVAAATSTIPVVFSVVTDPISAKLIDDWKPTGTNITGVSDLLPLEPRIALMKELIPNLKTVGYVYSPGEVNSTVVLKELEEKLAPEGIDVIAVPAARTTDIPMATRSLQGRVDLIYTSLDNNVVSAYESMFQAAKEGKIPLVASDTDSVARGAVAALGMNYYKMGRLTGTVVTRVLNGEKPGDIAPLTSDQMDLFVSVDNAHAVGFQIPESVVKSATQIVENSAGSPKTE